MFFGKKKKLLEEIKRLKERISELENEATQMEKKFNDYDALQNKYKNLSAECQTLKAQKTELEKKNKLIENFAKALDFNFYEKCTDQAWINQIKDSNKLIKNNNDYSIANAKKNMKISELKAKLEFKESSTHQKDASDEAARLRTILKRPKNTKLKCEYTAQYKVWVRIPSGRESLYNADIFIVDYSLYSFNEKGYCMKETEKTDYFLERFYWRDGGYIYFGKLQKNGIEKIPQIFPDNVPRAFIGKDGKEYTISFSLDNIVEPTPAEILQLTTKKQELKKLLIKSRELHKELNAIFNEIVISVSNSGVDLPEQAKNLKNLEDIRTRYKELEKKFSEFTKNANQKFKSKSEKLKK